MKLNSVFNVLLPKDKIFYELIEGMASNLLKCSNLFIELTTSTKEKHEDIYKKIKELETNGDTQLSNLFTELNTSFITPFDREDMSVIGDRLDDVLDGMKIVAKHVIIYKPAKLPKEANELALILKKECELIYSAMERLNSMKSDPSEVKNICKSLHGLEHEADEVYNKFILNLFETEKDVVELIKIKEIMQEIETVTDKADLLGKFLKTIVVKYA